MNRTPLTEQNRTIPVLIHNGKPVCESLIIVEYIDEVCNSKDTSPLLPIHPILTTELKLGFGPISSTKRCLIVQDGYGERVEEREAGKEEFIEVLKHVESQLGEKPFFGGDCFGFDDVALITYSMWFQTYEKRDDFSIEDHCPKLIGWVKRCLERESVSKSLSDPDTVYQRFLALKTMMGND